MAVFSIIKKSQLEGAKRLDAEYYQPEYLLLNEKLKKQKIKLLNELAFITDGIHASVDYDPDSNIRCFSAQAPKDNYFESVEQFISEKQHNANKRTALKEGDILLSSVGTIGNAAVVDQSMLPANADRHVGIIRLYNNQVISPYFLSTFLNSKYGRFQSVRESTGNVQLNLFIDKIKTFTVSCPNLAQMREVDKLAANAFQEREKAEHFYSQAEQMLLEELGLVNPEADGELWNVVNLSDAKAARRMDAEYFQPKYEKLFKKLGSKVKPLGNVARKTRRRPEIVEEKEYSYTEISDVNVGSTEVSCNAVVGRELPANANISVKGSEFLVSKVRPTRGAVAVVPADWKKDHIVSGAFSVYQVDSPMREYLLVILRSVVGKLQMEKPTTGTSYPTITDSDVENISIPILPEKTQQKIAELVQESHTARAKAKQLLEDAKRKVEELIESK